LKRQIIKAWIACVFGLSVFAHSQAVPTATQFGTMQIGLGGTIVSTDYTQPKAKGLSVYGTFDFTRHIGVEGDIHYASLFTPGDIGENTYLFGPRYVFHKNRFHPYAKVLLGIGTINYQFDFAPHYSTSHPAIALGGGIDIKATRSINVRAFDFEYQDWPTYSVHGLSPIVTTFGVAYAFH
jgi:hypothetical protein